MNLEEQIRIAKDITKECDGIMLSKGNDYANKDRLSNFKLVSQITGLTVSKVIEVFMATKVVRLGNLSNSDSEPNHESIRDNKIDLINYARLSIMNDVGSEEPKEFTKDKDF